MLFPLDVIKTVYPAFAGDLQTYVHVHECVGGNGGARQLVFPTKVPACTRLCRSVIVSMWEHSWCSEPRTGSSAGGPTHVRVMACAK